jgi:SRSO17 transposase
MAEDRDRLQDLDAWLAPFLTATGRKTGRHWAPFYLRGLLGLGERKSLQPMAARLGLSGHDQLQHFIASPAWDDSPLWGALAREADRRIGGADACLVIDDTALPKKGTRSMGVARQYCGQLGKKANCQSLVSLVLARRACGLVWCWQMLATAPVPPSAMASMCAGWLGQRAS